MYTVYPSSNMACMDEYIDQLAAEIQTPEPAQRVAHNILDEPIIETSNKYLLKPLLPGKDESSPPPHEGNVRKRKVIVDESDPHPLSKTF